MKELCSLNRNSTHGHDKYLSDDAENGKSDPLFNLDCFEEEYLDLWSDKLCDEIFFKLLRYFMIINEQ